MRRHIHQCRYVVLAIVAGLMSGSVLLSACGRTVQSAAPSSIPTAPALGATTSVLAAPFMLDGTIEQLAQERWVVAGTPVVLDAQTVITGTPTKGAMAHIQGELSTDAVILARTITVEVLATSTVAPTPTTAPT